MKVSLYVGTDFSGDFTLSDDGESAEELVTQAVRLWIRNPTWHCTYDFVTDDGGVIEAKIAGDARVMLTGVKRCGPW